MIASSKSFHLEMEHTIDAPLGAYGSLVKPRFDTSQLSFVRFILHRKTSYNVCPLAQI